MGVFFIYLIFYLFVIECTGASSTLILCINACVYALHVDRDQNTHNRKWWTVVHWSFLVQRQQNTIKPNLLSFLTFLAKTTPSNLVPILSLFAKIKIFPSKIKKKKKTINYYPKKLIINNIFPSTSSC